MASVTQKTQAGRDGWRIRFYCEGRRRELYVAGSGKRSERQANLIGRHVEELARAKSKNVLADPAAIAWARGTKGAIRQNLVAWGLADPESPKLSTDAGRLLGAFCDAYIESRTDVKPRTTINYRQVRRLLVEYFGESKLLAEITSADAERWRRWLLARVVRKSTESTPAETMSVATVSKHCKRAKTMFAEAVADRLLTESPFAKVKGGNESNPERQRFIDRETTQKILDACPDATWRCVFALARFGGLRCPSEVLGLRWSDVDWDKGRLRIDSPKTGLRFCPMFAELRTALSDAWELAPEGAIYVIERYRGAENLRTQFGRIVERAGVAMWPKPFVNLRSTRRTELQEQFPDHVINDWLGHSSAVAAKHYLQTTDAHWAAAVDVRSPIGSPISNDSEPIRKNQETKKPRKNRGSDGLGGVVMPPPMPPLGLEQASKTAGKVQGAFDVPPLVPPSQTIISDLIEVWELLSVDDRLAVIDFARRLADSSRTIP
jgi:integrase